MDPNDPIDVLNRLLRLLCRSLPVYLESTRPSDPLDPRDLGHRLSVIAADQRALARRVADAISERKGQVEAGHFPVEFTAINDLGACLIWFAGRSTIRSGTSRRWASASRRWPASRCCRRWPKRSAAMREATWRRSRRWWPAAHRGSGHDGAWPSKRSGWRATLRRSRDCRRKRNPRTESARGSSLKLVSLAPAQMSRTFSARGPLGPRPSSNSTDCPSRSSSKVVPSTDE